MKNLICTIGELKKSNIKNVVDSRMQEFAEHKNKSSNEIFKELCFCFLTANFSAQGGIKIQNEIGDGFLTLSQEELAQKLSEIGHRFPNARAKYIYEARKHKDNTKKILNSFSDEKNARNWIVANIKGIGMKEASHFLRNVGYKNVAIIDFHIVDLLERENLIQKPKTMTPKKYIEIEKVLEQLAQKTNSNLGELDLYLWYKETGKILK